MYLKRSGITGAVVVLGLLAGAVGLLSGGRPQMAVGASLLTAVTLDAVAARLTLSPVTVSLHGPHQAVAGEETEWIVRADGIRRPVVMSPAVLPRSPRFILRSAEPSLIVLPPYPRGLVTDVVIDLTATGPLGLFQAGRRMVIRLSTPLAVGPTPLPVDLDWPTPKAVSFGLTEGAPIGDDLFRSIRPYRRGDERRRIHWGLTAHHGRLMVRENDGTGVVAVRIVVEPGQAGPQADHVTGMASTIAAGALSKGWLVQLVTADAHVTPSTPHRLTSPFGPALPTLPMAATGTTTRTEQVAAAEAVNRQLATAAHGPIAASPWPGLTCVVGPQGPRWS